jgi:hypothetical protein
MGSQGTDDPRFATEPAPARDQADPQLFHLNLRQQLPPPDPGVTLKEVRPCATCGAGLWGGRRLELVTTRSTSPNQISDSCHGRTAGGNLRNNQIITREVLRPIHPATLHSPIGDSMIP